MQKPLETTSLVLAIVSTVCLVIGVTTDHWFKIEIDNFHIGLWRECFGDNCLKLVADSREYVFRNRFNILDVAALPYRE